LYDINVVIASKTKKKLKTTRDPTVDSNEKTNDPEGKIMKKNILTTVSEF
jgi:hypothetical protein